MIDSGASISTFHAEIGKAIGLNIEKGEIHEPFNADGGTGRNYLHEVQIYFPGGPVTTKASFSANLPCYALLGMMGFFEYFTITFDPVGRQVHLERLHPA